MTAARKIRAAVVGASGYAGSELTRFLLAHPAVELTHLYVSAASSDAGRAIAEIDGRLFGRTQLVLEPMTDPAAAAQGLDAAQTPGDAPSPGTPAGARVNLTG